MIYFLHYYALTVYFFKIDEVPLEHFLRIFNQTERT